MTNISKKLKKVHFSVHFSVAKKKPYSTGIYSGGVKLSDWPSLSAQEKKQALNKDWYLRWSYRNPKTEKMERQTNIKGGVNYYHTKKERTEMLRIYERNLKHLLENGFSPYNQSSIMISFTTVPEVLDYALQVKEKEVSETTYMDYRSRINSFKEFLENNGVMLIEDVDKRIVSRFLNQFNAKSSNNYRAALSSIFTILSDESIIKNNFIKELRNKPTRKKSNKVFDQKVMEDSLKKLKKQDSVLLVYIEMISYMFWRPIETVRLKIDGIDFENMTMRADTKGKDNKMKRIPSMFLNTLKEFVADRDGFVFELNATKDRDKRTYLTHRFKTFREKNKLDPSLTPYVYRHYYITKLYRTLRKSMNKKETIEELSLITGHDSKAIWNYIHVNDIELADDYSDLLKQ